MLLQHWRDFLVRHCASLGSIPSNSMSRRHLIRGATWLQDSNHSLDAEFSHHSPALCEHNGSLFVAWTGTDEFWSLNVMRSADGLTFADKCTIPHEDSAHGPALVSWDGKLYIFWVGTDPQHQLNFMSSDNGTDWPPESKHIVGESSADSPTAVRVDVSGVFLAWTDAAKRMHVGKIDTESGKFEDPPQQLNDQVSNFRPSLLSYNNPADLSDHLLFLSFSGTDEEHNIYIMSSYAPHLGDFNRWESARSTTGYSSPPAGPTLGLLNPYDFTAAMVGYVRGDNHHLDLNPISLI